MTQASPSKLKRPAERLIQRFDVHQIGDDTIQAFLEAGFSLAICCAECPRVTEWTPPELERRFGDRLSLRIADLVPRLRCTGDEGCESGRVAVFPHLYDQPWAWSPPTR